MKFKSLRRILRTLMQAGGASVLVGIVVVFVELSDKQVVALTGGLTVVLSFIQNAIEDTTGTDILIPKGE